MFFFGPLLFSCVNLDGLWPMLNNVEQWLQEGTNGRRAFAPRLPAWWTTRCNTCRPRGCCKCTCSFGCNVILHVGGTWSLFSSVSFQFGLFSLVTFQFGHFSVRSLFSSVTFQFGHLSIGSLFSSVTFQFGHFSIGHFQFGHFQFGHFSVRLLSVPKR